MVNYRYNRYGQEDIDYDNEIFDMLRAYQGNPNFDFTFKTLFADKDKNIFGDLEKQDKSTQTKHTS